MKIIATFTCVTMLALAGCGKEPPVVVSTPVIVKVPVNAPCVSGTRPSEPTGLKSLYTREQWAALSTDQRERALVANGLDRKVYGDNLFVATAGCQ